MKSETIQLISKNKKALFDYEVIESWEAGIVLKWHEVKALRKGNINLKGSFISIQNGELYLMNCHISPISSIAKSVIDSKPQRKLLIHKKVIPYLIGKIKEAGNTLVPIEIYFKGSLIKVRFALASGRKKYDKKQLLKERSMDREAKMMMNQYT